MRNQLLKQMPVIVVIIPVLNEEQSIGKVLAAIPASPGTTVIVADNGSQDRTVDIAKQYGAVVTVEPERGYGATCLRALREAERFAPDIVVFLDGDYSDYPEEMPLLLAPLLEDNCDLVIGSRVRGTRQKGALLPQAVFGNWLSTRLLHLFWGARFTDLGPFRAVTWQALQQMQMRDRNFGWTVEMQIRASQLGLRCREVPVSYRKRIGRSKVTGTVKGTILAGIVILRTIGTHALRDVRRRFGM